MIGSCFFSNADCNVKNGGSIHVISNPWHFVSFNCKKIMPLCIAEVFIVLKGFEMTFCKVNAFDLSYQSSFSIVPLYQFTRKIHITHHKGAFLVHLVAFLCKKISSQIVLLFRCQEIKQLTSLFFCSLDGLCSSYWIIYLKNSHY